MGYRNVVGVGGILSMNLSAPYLGWRTCRAHGPPGETVWLSVPGFIRAHIEAGDMA